MTTKGKDVFEVIPMRSTVPVGAEYHVYNKNRDRTILKAGDLMPECTKDNDRYICGDYEYTYRCAKKYPGWFVRLRADKKRGAYEKILDNINNYPVVDVSLLFKGCVNIKIAPSIPDSVKYMNKTFEGCSALKFNIHINKGVIETNYTYKDCISIEHTGSIPSSIESMKGMYSGCMLHYPPDPNYKIEAFENCCFDLLDHTVFVSENHELDIESYKEGKTRQYLPHEAWERFMEFKDEYECDWLPF